MSLSPSRLFIVGAPKCGTTSLASWLSDHPQICMSQIKESHYFSHDLAGRVVKHRKEYEELFGDPSPQTRWLLDASVSYIYSGVAVPTILAEFPDAKFIVMTRDPVDMAISLFYHNRFNRYESEESLERAWGLQERRARGESIPALCRDPFLLQYQQACALGTLVQRLHGWIEAPNLLHLTLKEVHEDTPTAYRRVLRFLDLADDGRRSFPVRNQAGEHRSPLLGGLLLHAARLKARWGITKRFGLMRLSRRPLDKKEISPEFRKEMEDAFAKEARLLASLEFHGRETSDSAPS